MKEKLLKVKVGKCDRLKSVISVYKHACGKIVFVGIHTLDDDVFVRKKTNFPYACLYGEITLFRRSHLPPFNLYKGLIET